MDTVTGNGWIGDGLGLLRRTAGAVVRGVQWVVGFCVLLALLAVTTAVPIAQFYALGYLLDASGRVARTGRVRDGFPLIDRAPRLGSIAIGTWIVILPLRILAAAAADARIIDAGSRADALTHKILGLFTILTFLHLSLALARGGRFSFFFRPISNLRWLRRSEVSKSESDIRDFISQMEIKRRTWLGVRGFFGSLICLVPPTLLFAVADKTEGPAILITLIGGVILATVLSWMPFLQARFAKEDRFGALFEFRATRRLFAHAPIAWVIAVLLTLGLSLPLYLFKVVIPPADAVWLITLAFVVGLYPGKVMAGWAYHRACKRETPASFPIRAFARLLLLPTLGSFMILLFITQFIGEHGKGTLFEHHAFLLRVGF